MKKALSAFFVLLTGCAGVETAPNYPAHDTAVVRTYVHNLGFKGLFASEGTQTVSTRADMRRSEDQFQFSGFVMKHLAKTRDSAHILRVDKNLRWDLNLKDKTYTECPLAGCPSPRPESARRPEPEQAPAPEQPRRKPSCTLTVVKNRLTVEPLGQTKEINGFKTREYKVAWEITAQGTDKNKTTSSLTVDLWTTPEDDPRIRAVQAVDRKFAAAMREQADAQSRTKKAFPAAALKMFETQFLTGFASGRRPSLEKAAQELGKIHGYPISTSVNWYLNGSACQAASEPQQQAGGSSGLDFGHVVGGLLGGGAAAQNADGNVAKPVFGFVEEVREMDVAPASDGLFVPPPSFKLKNRN